MTSAVKPTADTAVRERILAMLRDWNDHDAGAVMKHFTDDVAWMQPMLDAPVHGRAAATEVVEDTLRSMPDLTFPLDDVDIFVAEGGRRAMARFRFTATMTGPMDPPGFAPTGRKAEVDGACYYELRGGLISRHLVLFDGMKLAQDLGLLPRTDSLATKAMVGTQRVAETVTKGVGRLIHR